MVNREIDCFSLVLPEFRLDVYWKRAEHLSACSERILEVGESFVVRHP